MATDSPMTHCLMCGTAVELKAVRNRFGRCEPCYERFTRGRDISSHLPKHAVFASYGPGFAEDLTSWDTVIRFDGKLEQTIRWYEYVHGKRGTEIRKAVVDDDGVLEVLAKIEAIDRLGIATLNKHHCMDDAEMIFISAPELGFHASISLYTFSFVAKRESMSGIVKSGLETFRVAWQAIESRSPYRTSMHWRKS
jgi:hypothetical protein